MAHPVSPWPRHKVVAAVAAPMAGAFVFAAVTVAFRDVSSTPWVAPHGEAGAPEGALHVDGVPVGNAPRRPRREAASAAASSSRRPCRPITRHDRAAERRDRSRPAADA